ncbi:hypothetical protein, conserved, partial [Eimeria tenella]
ELQQQQQQKKASFSGAPPKAHTQRRLLQRAAPLITEVPRGEVQGTAVSLFRDRDGDEAFEFFSVDATGRPCKVPVAALQCLGRRPLPMLL